MKFVVQERPLFDQDLSCDTIRILYFARDPDDAGRVESFLSSQGLSCEVDRAHDERDFLPALRNGDFDLILADYSVSVVDGAAASKARKAAPRVPLIFISDTFDEEAAIESLEAGATDYVEKDRLPRLVFSVKRALRESAEERHRGEVGRVLRDGQTRLELALQASGIGVWSWDVDRDRFGWDEKVCELFRVPAKSHPDLETFLALVHEEDRDQVESMFRTALEARGEFYAEYRLATDDETERHLASRGQFLDDDSDGGSSRAIGVCWDITNQKREEQRLLLLSTVLESAANAIMITDPDGRITWVNSAFTELTGYTLSDVLGKNPRLLKSGKQHDGFYRDMWQTISRGATWHGQLVNRRKDSTLYTEEMTISPVLGPYGETARLVCMKRDITLEENLTRQLHQAQRLEAVGRLAGGVAHDFNNLLTVIAGNAELALGDLAPQDPVSEALREITEASGRAAALTRQLLAFSRKQVLQPRMLDLNALVARTEKMLRRVIGEDIKLSTRLQQNLRTIKADPGQLEQILMNLAVNARDAMPEGGELIFETENMEMYATQTGQGGVRMHSGSYVRLTVTDTGHGMDEDTQSRIFEPFFTTKGKGKGTGLGLATVYGIVKQSGGYIWIDSTPGQGSAFKVYFPQVDGVPKGLVEDAPIVPASRGETILVVEDEATVLKFASTSLERAGYTVITANNGADALRLIKAYPKTVHLLVTDVVMPEMSGRALADSIRPLREGLPVLYTSGYVDDAIVHHGILDSGAHLLEKPYTQRSLLSAVRKVLDLGGSGSAR